jgi:meso-butanediol dehydrogenase/(S,S)-butanediol dehydrogenase/diacetyl reductase
MKQLFVTDAFAGRAVLITGATSGIGRASAEAFAACGASVMCSGRDEERGEALVEVIRAAGGTAEFIAGDVTDSVFCDALVSETAERFGCLDALFNNAGIALIGKIDEFSDADWKRIVDVNLNAVFYVARAAVRQMKRNGGGAIVNMSSISGLHGFEGSPAYAATKGAVVLLTKALALDHAKDKIRVNAICPGDIDTGMTDEFYASEGKDPVELRAWLFENTPLGRIGNVEELAQCVLFLASDGAAFMTGAMMSVDGGLCAR